MRIRPILPLFAAAVLVAGCHKAPPKQVALDAAFHAIPLPPDASALLKEGGTDAMQLVLVTPVRPDSVLAFYRRVLSADPFHLVNEQGSGTTTALYAEQDAGPPIWVTIGPNGKDGSQVTLAGAKDAEHNDSTGKNLKTGDSGAATTLPVKKP